MMIPWYYAAISAGVGSLAGSVLMIVYYRNYSEAAEYFEQLAAGGFSAVAAWAQAKAVYLKAPGK